MAQGYKMKRTVLFPYTETLVGGSYISSSLIAQYLKYSTNIVPRILLPGYGLNTEVFTRVGLDPEYYGLQQKHIEQIHHSSGLTGKSRSAPAYLAAYRKAKQFLRDIRPDVVHINDDTTILTWGAAAHNLGIPVIWHIRQEKGHPFLDRIRLRFSNYLIFLADANRVRFKSHVLPPNFIIHNGVDFKTFYPTADHGESKVRLGFEANVVTIGFVGNMVARKRPEWAVQAAIDLLKMGKEIQLIIIGKDFSQGDYERKLRQLVNAEGCAKNIRFLGFRTDIADLMRAMDILVLTSIPQGEAFPRVVLEAMASKAAILATRVAGVPEAITDELTGLLADPANYNDFLFKLTFLVENRHYREKMASKALDEVRIRFSAKTCARKVVEVYNIILEKQLYNYVQGG